MRNIIQYEDINTDNKEQNSSEKRKQIEEEGENSNPVKIKEFMTMKYRNISKSNKKKKKLSQKAIIDQENDHNEIDTNNELNQNLSFNSKIHQIQGPLKVENIQTMMIDIMSCVNTKDSFFTNANDQTKLIVGIIPKLDQLLKTSPIQMKKNPFLTEEVEINPNLSSTQSDAQNHWSKFQSHYKYSFVTMSKSNQDQLSNFVLNLMRYDLDAREYQEKNASQNKSNKGQNLNNFEKLMLEPHQMSGYNITTSLDEVNKRGGNNDNWVETCPNDLKNSKPTKVYAIDCEMCQSKVGRELTRVSIVNYNGEVILDELVKPENEIIEYNTMFSGITEEILSKAKFTFKEIQTKILEIINDDCIIVGHALKNDLDSLKLIHPYLIDTSIIYDHTFGPPYFPSLKWLSKKYLNKEIQVQSDSQIGHDSIEDALACIDLLKLKIRNGPNFGLSRVKSESIVEYLDRKAPNFTSSLIGTDTRIHLWAKDSELIISESSDEIFNDTKRALLDHRFITFYNSKLNELFNGNKGNSSEGDGDSESTQPKIDSDAGNAFIQQLNDFIETLPSNTALILLSGHSHHPEYHSLYKLKQQFNSLYKTVKLSEIPDDAIFTDAHAKRMRQLVEICRLGMGILAIKS